MIGIYKITSPSGRIYIGQSVSIERRKGYYGRLACVDQPKLYSSLVKYGFSEHIFEVVEECREDELNVRERHWQDFYDATSGENLNCMLTSTDDRSGGHSEETRKKISESKKGGVGPNKGRRFTPEHRKAISEGQKGIKRGPLSEELRSRLKEIAKKRWEGPLAEELRSRISETAKKRWEGPLGEELRLKMSEDKKELHRKIKKNKLS